MPVALTEQDTAERRSRVLQAARWCFLNFGFAKTSLEDIAKRANLSRTLLYRTFRDKEDIFTAVFSDWLVARHPEAKRAAAGPGSPAERLLAVCRLMVLEPWSDMVAAPMGSEFFDVCSRIDPEIEELHRQVALECVESILGDEATAEVFQLAVEGLLTDQPTLPALDRRLQILVARFVPSESTNRRKDRR
jgi:AcrR family transcriptional regulator